MFTTPAAERAPVPATNGPTLAQVQAIQAVRGCLCVSVLMSTTARAQMDAADAGRLRDLLLEAQRRLDAEQDTSEAAAALERLAALAVRAAQAPTSAGLALYASATYGAHVALPLSVVERVVVDPSFATRDLVRCLHRVPRHVVLVLGAQRARLLEVARGRMVEAEGSFPLTRQAPARGLIARTGARDGVTRPYLHAVDRALGAFLAAQPAPLVLVGPAALVAAFRARSRNLARLAGEIIGEHGEIAAGDLLALVRPVADEHLHSRRRQALETIAARTDAGLVATGMVAAWAAAAGHRPEVLVVEDTLVYPARVSGEHGQIITAAGDVEAPDVLDDAVDELIEAVMGRGGWVALVEEGTLSARGGVALAFEESR